MLGNQFRQRLDRGEVGANGRIQLEERVADVETGGPDIVEPRRPVSEEPEDAPLALEDGQRSGETGPGQEGRLDPRSRSKSRVEPLGLAPAAIVFKRSRCL